MKIDFLRYSNTIILDLYNMDSHEIQFYKVRLKNEDDDINKRFKNSIIHNNDNGNYFLNLIHKTIYKENIIMHNVYLLIRLYLIHTYDLAFSKNENILFDVINHDFIKNCINVLINKKCSNENIKKFYDEHYIKIHFHKDDPNVNDYNISSILISSSTELITNIENNIKMHFTKYIKKYLKIFFEKYVIKLEIKNLIEDKKEFNKILCNITDIIQDNLEYENHLFHDFINEHKQKICPNNLNYLLDKTPQLLIKYQIFIIKALEPFNIKLYQFFPLKSHKNNHIHINNECFVNLIEYKYKKEIIEHDKIVNEAFFKNNKKANINEYFKNNDLKYKHILWSLFFDFNNKIFKNKEFEYSFSTNGYEICLMMIHKNYSQINKNNKYKQRLGRINSNNETKDLEKEEKKTYYDNKEKIRNEKNDELNKKFNDKKNELKKKYQKAFKKLEHDKIIEINNNLIFSKKYFNPYLQLFLNAYLINYNNEIIVEPINLDINLIKNTNYKNLTKNNLLIQKLLNINYTKIPDYINKTNDFNILILDIFKEYFYDEGIIIDKYLENLIFEIEHKYKMKNFDLKNPDSVDVIDIYEKYVENKIIFDKDILTIKEKIKKFKKKKNNINNNIKNKTILKTYKYLKKIFFKLKTHVDNLNLFFNLENFNKIIEYLKKFYDYLNCKKISSEKFINIDFNDNDAENKLNINIQNVITKIKDIKKIIKNTNLLKKHNDVNIKNPKIINYEKELLIINNEKNKNLNMLKSIFKSYKNNMYIDEIDNDRLKILNNLNWVVIDPGKNTILNMMSKNKILTLKHKNNKSKKRMINIMFKYTNKQRLFETKRLLYSKKIEKIKNENGLKKIEKILSKYSTKTCIFNNFIKYAKKINKYISLIKHKYNEKKEIYKINRNSYINKKRSNAKLINKIKKKFGEDVVLIYGDWSNKMSIKKISTPNNEIKKLLNDNFIVLDIDEYNTSKIDNIYENECKNYESVNKNLNQKQKINELKIKKTIKKVTKKLEKIKKTTPINEVLIKNIEKFIEEKKNKIKKVSKKIHGILIFKKYKLDNKTKKETKIDRSGCLNRDMNAVYNMEKIVKNYIIENKRLKNFRRDKLIVLKVSNHIYTPKTK